ncbi:hypothetical protein CLCR_01009 [Cladophialophora carrionii]|uniref:Uncharacterized protein n=1 Tax=Cladophialophora carrionii TaxID=86049 RepID=A0A1C1D127_9EURO|nr:hypothetical protein CLCR_01009 [Cladophialophora carrionii]
MPRPRKPDQDGKEVKKRSRNGCWLVHAPPQCSRTPAYIYTHRPCKSRKVKWYMMNPLRSLLMMDADRVAAAEKRSRPAPTACDKARRATTAFA